MGRRQRQRRREGAADGQSGRPANQAAASEGAYPDDEGNELVLRGVLSPATRREYATVLAGRSNAPGGEAAREDAWHRAVEFLFERLAVRWVIAGAPLTGQRELLGRLRMASPEERTWVREVLRRHCAEHFPDVQAP